MDRDGPQITLLAGGVGAARLLRGLAAVVPAERLTVIVNTADDDEFYGLHVSPDIDTIVYTLAGRAPLDRGWGIDGDTQHCRQELDRLDGPGWFALGDRDLAMHLVRTRQLRLGRKLSTITRNACRAWGVGVDVRPMSNDPVRTVVTTPQGDLPFQEWLVRHRARPKVERLAYRLVRRARPGPGVLDAIERSAMIIVAPSNPLTSIAPMLALRGLRSALRRRKADVVAVSPLIGGKAVKGPLATMLRDLGMRGGTDGIADFYHGLASRLVVAVGDHPGPRRARAQWPQMEFLQEDIAIADPARAETLARFLVETLPGAAGSASARRRD
jgi:LPPG:FO 2-phospho-L-lactate transferase